ncbi:hypothetical protein EXN22_13215 [Pseudomonas tructae]|uniref:Uncharacterized protein n=1 Tax=Pseudomonas tructae TaxID=2518644 RepID=A0A411MID6_9PSED|nr:hypothetical protein [Pseudomonas tructae]QBF26605.1 hypothetical protein EXN22_13215 [Pseudomonas tructae]
MLNITAEDITQLNDEELRKLVGGLCKAELKVKGLSTSHVRFGGDQNVSDGGLNVVVRLPPEYQIDDFIPRNCTGIQVKKSTMPAAAILEEMKPAPERQLRRTKIIKGGMEKHDEAFRQDPRFNEFLAFLVWEISDKLPQARDW